MQSKEEFKENFNAFAVMAAKDGKIGHRKLTGDEIPSFIAEAFDGDDDDHHVQATSFQDRRYGLAYTLYEADDGWLDLEITNCEGKLIATLAEDEMFSLDITHMEPNADGSGYDPRYGIVTFEFRCYNRIHHRLMDAVPDPGSLDWASLSEGEFISLMLTY